MCACVCVCVCVYVDSVCSGQADVGSPAGFQTVSSVFGLRSAAAGHLLAGGKKKCYTNNN